jgi:hypothetical protein
MLEANQWHEPVCLVLVGVIREWWVFPPSVFAP